MTRRKDPAAGRLRTLEEVRERARLRHLREAEHPWRARITRARGRLLGRYGIIRHDLDPRVASRRVRWFIQRGRRGWADCDAWSLDCYIARILAQALPRLGAGYAYPGTGQWDTPVKWTAYVNDLAGRCGAWNEETFCDRDAYEITREAVREFGDNLGVFWD